MTRLLVPAAALLLGLSLASCGDAAGPGATDPVSPSAPPTTSSLPPGQGRPTAVPPAPGTVSTAGLVTVLDDGHGAELCLGGVADSLPPQCGGPRLVGWDWKEHAGTFEHRSGVRWGLYAVTGRFDGTDVSPTSVIPSASYDAASLPETDELATPCATPAGGWRPVDPATTTQATLEKVMAAAQGLDGYAASWVDQSINPADPETDPEAMNDPTKEVVDVRVVGDTDAARQRLRAVYGGALCVSPGTRTAAELTQVQSDLDDLPGMLSSSYGVDGVVDLEVTYDDGSIQAWADRTYGDGVVRVTPALTDS